MKHRIIERDGEFFLSTGQEINGVEVFEGHILLCDSPTHSDVLLEVRFGTYKHGPDDWEAFGFYLQMIGEPFQWDFRISDFERGDYQIMGHRTNQAGGFPS